MTNEIFFRLYDNLVKLLKYKNKAYNKGDTITTFIEKREQICLLLEGEVDLIRYDSSGQKIIIHSFEKGQIFGEFFHVINSNNELFVVAKTDCLLFSFNYRDLIDFKNSKGNCYSEIIECLLLNLKLKIMESNERIEILTKQTIREKLLSYFEVLSFRKMRRQFYLPFSYIDLADYLVIDRSAMMRELKNLVDEGFIDRDKNKITLLY